MLNFSPEARTNIHQRLQCSTHGTDGLRSSSAAVRQQLHSTSAALTIAHDPMRPHEALCRPILIRKAWRAGTKRYGEKQYSQQMSRQQGNHTLSFLCQLCPSLRLSAQAPNTCPALAVAREQRDVPAQTAARAVQRRSVTWIEEPVVWSSSRRTGGLLQQLRASSCSSQAQCSLPPWRV